MSGAVAKACARQRLASLTRAASGCLGFAGPYFKHSPAGRFPLSPSVAAARLLRRPGCSETDAVPIVHLSGHTRAAHTRPSSQTTDLDRQFCGVVTARIPAYRTRPSCGEQAGHHPRRGICCRAVPTTCRTPCTLAFREGNRENGEYASNSPGPGAPYFLGSYTASPRCHLWSKSVGRSLTASSWRRGEATAGSGPRRTADGGRRSGSHRSHSCPTLRYRADSACRSGKLTP